MNRLARLAVTGAKPEPLLTVREVSERLGVPVSWVYSKAESGELPSFKVGRYRRFETSEVEEWLLAQRKGRSGDGD